MQEEKDIFFDYIGPDGIQRKGEVLTPFAVEGMVHKYVLCSVPNNEDKYDIMPFILKEEADNSVSFEEILDENEYNKVLEELNKFLNRDEETPVEM